MAISSGEWMERVDQVNGKIYAHIIKIMRPMWLYEMKITVKPHFYPHFYFYFYYFDSQKPRPK